MLEVPTSTDQAPHARTPTLDNLLSLQSSCSSIPLMLLLLYTFDADFTAWWWPGGVELC